jgi:hypothetical protein
MKAKLFLLATAFILISVKSFAGWYNTYNYTGLVGRYPVTLSFQIKEGYFGEPAKKGFNIIGVYKYDKVNHPIRLEGVFNQNTQTIKIYEIGVGNKVAATFHLNFSLQQLTGTWSSSTSKLKVNLRLADRLSDRSDESFDNIQILQYPSLKNYYFIGIYAKKSESTEAHMRALKIMDKRTNKTFQTFNFDNIETPTGNLMTIIYDNITIGKGNSFLVSNQIGRVGGYLNVDFNIKEKQFVLDPEPVAEGIN